MLTSSGCTPCSKCFFSLCLAVNLAQSIYAARFGCERLRVRVPSVPMLSSKLTVLEITLDKEITANLSRRNSYDTRGAGPGCDGLIWLE